ncbi:MAG: hypothetical protein AAF842_12550, partial [Planctomycetota bacterium]
RGLELGPRLDLGRRVTLVAHADWSVQPAKRVICIAQEGQLAAPQRVDTLASLDDLVDHLMRRGQPALLGVDLPLGFPLAYARRVGITSFREGLARALSWPAFFEVAAEVADIGLERPFYPARGGRVKMDDLVAALGLEARRDLRRLCDFDPVRGTAQGAPLFWTMGANQVGKAALSFWQHVLPSALAAGDQVALWPFDGPLDELLGRHGVGVSARPPLKRQDTQRWRRRSRPARRWCTTSARPRPKATPR